MKTYRLWITLLAGLIVVLFMFGRLVRGAEEAYIFNAVTNDDPIVLFQMNSETTYFQTNITSGDNATGCHICEMLRGPGAIPAIYHPFHDAGPWKPATERWWTTNIVQVSKLKLIWRGEPEEITRTKTVTNVTVRSKLKQEWSEPEADKVVTNWIRSEFLVPTNGITWSNGVYSNLWIAGHMVKVITNAHGTFTIEGLPQDKGIK